MLYCFFFFFFFIQTLLSLFPGKNSERETYVERGGGKLTMNNTYPYLIAHVPFLKTLRIAFNGSMRIHYWKLYERNVQNCHTLFLSTLWLRGRVRVGGRRGGNANAQLNYPDDEQINISLPDEYLTQSTITPYEILNIHGVLSNQFISLILTPIETL